MLLEIAQPKFARHAMVGQDRRFEMLALVAPCDDLCDDVVGVGLSYREGWF